MKTLLTFQVETSSTQKASALRDYCASVLEKDENATLVASSMARDEQTYRVILVNTSSKKVSEEVIEADSPESAASQAVGTSKQLVVATVLPV